MPALAGDQLALMLRRIPDWEAIPIILLTNENPNPLRVTKAQLLGKIEFLVSPLEPSDLLQILQAYC
jgi:twitching motility two-component system response regulator PilG